MAVLTQTTKHPAVSPNATPIPGPIDPDVLRANLNTYVASAEEKAQQAVAFVEQMQAAWGNGALSGGIITAGVGFSVSVAALKALVGTVVETDAALVIGGLTPSTANNLYVRQDGTGEAIATGASPNYPTDISAHGDFLLWGTATCDGSGVTAVTNDRRLFQTFGRLSKSVAGAADVTLTTAEARNRTLEFTGVLTGNINVIVPLFDGAEWIVKNGTTGAFTLTVKGASGAGIVVAAAKTAVLRGDGTNILRVTADNP